MPSVFRPRFTCSLSPRMPRYRRTSMKRYAVALLVMLAPAFASAQTNPATQAARQWRERHERTIMGEFEAFLSIPDVAQDRENIQRNADFIAKMMEMRGIAPRQISIPGANPVVFGEIGIPGAQRTIVFYAHYDGQPVDPKQWTSPPFTPTLRSRTIERGGDVIPFPWTDASFDPESRLYARAAGDDKLPIMAIMSALDAIRAAGVKAKSNVKFVFEGEEEAGSTNLEKNPERQQGTFLRRPMANLRFAHASQPAAADRFRCSRYPANRYYRVWCASRTPWSTLRQLGSEPAVDAFPAAGFHEG
jgi:hypothetical protein